VKLTSEEQAELEAARAESFTTRRPTVAALEERLFSPISCLDHGFVRLIDYMGDDGAIVQAARVSYGRGTRSVRRDRGLIRYLMRHRHTTPLEMCELKLHVKLPIFVARQWIRHRTANVNEMSGRYSVLDREFYMPEPEHLAKQSTTNNQGRGQTLSAAQSAMVLDLLKRDAAQTYGTYERLMDEDIGLARELARMNLPVNLYTQWYWKVDLHNLLHFLSLRADAHAQHEIRVYADAIGDMVKDWVPAVWEAFQDYRVSGTFLSGREAEIVNRALSGTLTPREASIIGTMRQNLQRPPAEREKISFDDTGLSAREWRALLSRFQIQA
jgi:thymidylate synthase (FAD)